jgi:GNAT superfamily N-acetyltransferase
MLLRICCEQMFADRQLERRGMPGAGEGQPSITVHPLTPDRWPDLEALFGKNGACGGCWCMWWFQPGREFQQMKGEQNKRAFQALVEAGDPPGVLAYVDGKPAGWCALGPREQYPRLERSRTLKRVDDEPVWSVVCFFIARPFRKQGMTGTLLRAAVAYARQHGARIVEGYPIEPRNRDVPAAFAWTGFTSAFQAAGFIEVARRSKCQPIVRLELA